MLNRCGCRAAGNGGGSRAGGGPRTGSCATTTSATWPTAATPRPPSAPTRSTCCTSPAGSPGRASAWTRWTPTRCCGTWPHAGPSARPGQHDNVISLASGRASGFAPATINRRLAAVSGLFSFRSMRDPAAVNPMPRGPAARRAAAGERAGLLGHLARPGPRSKLRVREPRRLPRGLDRAETAALLSSFRTDRDRAIAGLMLLSGLRSAEVLGLAGRRRGHRARLGAGDRQGRQGTPGPARSRRRGADPGLPARRAAGDRVPGVVHRGEGAAPGAAADRGRAAAGVPLPPGGLRGGRRAPARAAAFVRHRPGRGRGRPAGAAGADGPRPCRFLGCLHPPGARACARRL